jgi:hypothetical protein
MLEGFHTTRHYGGMVKVNKCDFHLSKNRCGRTLLWTNKVAGEHQRKIAMFLFYDSDYYYIVFNEFLVWNRITRT